MKRSVAVMVLALGLGVIVTKATAGKPAKAASTMKEENCGAMMKSLVPLPTKFAELMTAVADGMTAHANWIAGNKDPKAQTEATNIKKIAQDHRDMAAAAKKAAADMEAAGTMAPAMHDMSKMDQKAMADSMMKQAALEKEMANMMLKHAEETEKQVQAMSKGGQAGQP